MKALVLLQASSTREDNARQVADTLKRFGYEVHVTTISNSGAGLSDLLGAWNPTTKLTANGFSFACLSRPQNATFTGELLDLINGDLCPFFVPNVIEDGSFQYSPFGCDRTVSWTPAAPSAKEATYTGMGTIAIQCAHYQAPSSNDTRASGRTVLASVDTAPSTYVCWKLTDGTHNCYFHADAAAQEGVSYFPILLQYAVNDGAINAPKNKLCLTWDLDDWPTDAGTGGGWNLADVQAWVLENRTDVTIGIHASPTDGGRNELADIWGPMGVVDVIAANQVSNGGRLYPIEHVGGEYWSAKEIDGGSGVAQPAGGQTKADIDTNYRANVANLTAHGIYQGSDEDYLDSWGYHYFNTNRIDSAGIDLMSPETGKFADPLGVTAKAGYGIKVARCDSLYPDGNPVVTQYGGMEYRGVLLVESQGRINSTETEIDPNNQTGGSSANGSLSGTLRDYLNSGVNRCPMYIHGQNGNAYSDTVTYPNNIMRNLVSYMNNIATFCTNTVKAGHPSEYVAIEAVSVPSGGTGEQSIISHNIIKH